MIKNRFLYKFLGIERIKELSYAIRNQPAPLANVSTTGVLIALSLALLPSAGHYIIPYSKKLDISTVLIGVTTCLSLVLRRRLGIPFESVRNWGRAFKLTHVAFALGCVPTVILVLFRPEALYMLGNAANGDSTVNIHSTFGVASFVLGVSIWAGLTEEIIFRGMLLSILRRWRVLNKQAHRDVFAVLLSSLVFGLGHVSLWGLSLSLAVTGLGIGFGMAYIATKEVLLPLVIYHAMFDALSLTFSFVSYKLG